jgi:hypothetical protein
MITQPASLSIGSVEIELLHQGELFLGLGEITIDGQVVRNNSLPMRPYMATHFGIEFDRFVIEQVESLGVDGVILHTRALGIGLNVPALQDHSLDPVWSIRPWNERVLAEIQVDWILKADTREISGRTWTGFSYSIAFKAENEELYYVMDRATWELGGEAVGVTLLRQQMGGDPIVTVAADTRYSTAANIPFPLNPVMTHDCPRWASEQGFDYQYRGDVALIGLFAECSLIRTIVARDPGDEQIRHFDKHIFDQTAAGQTITKFIGIAMVGDDTDHLNAWTQVFDADQDNVLGQFGMERTYARTTLSHNFWNNFNCDSYLEDLIPAAAALGFQQIFIDPYWENDMTSNREGILPDFATGNMCCPHEYEVAKVLGGIEGYKRVAEIARAQGVELISWIGSHQSQNSPYLRKHPVEVIKGPDGRHTYGSGYDAIYGMDISSPFGTMFRDNILRGQQATTVSGYLYDSFYNFGWMPINFHTPDPNKPTDPHQGKLCAHTMWRQLAEIMAYWQQSGVHMLIESLGPWGQPQHGVQGNYRAAGGAMAYQCAVNIGYSVIPTPDTSTGKEEVGPEFYFRLLAHKAPSTLSLWVNDADGKRARIDQVASPLLRAANLAYRAVQPRMHTRTILHDDAGVKWQDRQGNLSVIYTFKPGQIALPADTAYRNVLTDAKGTGSINAEAWQVYEIMG